MIKRVVLLRALRRCVPELVKLGIIELVQKEYPAEQLTIKTEPEKGIEFKDSAPVIIPGDIKPESIPEPVKEPEPTATETISESVAKSRQMLDDNDF